MNSKIVGIVKQLKFFILTALIVTLLVNLIILIWKGTYGLLIMVGFGQALALFGASVTSGYSATAIWSKFVS